MTVAEKTKSAFTVVPHEVLDSPAARACSATEYVLLIQALRDSFRGDFEFHHGHLAHRIPTVSRKRFDVARAGLVRRGFIEPVNGRWGIFRMSDKWQSYTPSPEENGILRAPKPHTKSISRESKQHTKSEVRVSFRQTSCAVSDDFVRQNGTPSYKYKEQTPPPTPQRGDAGGGELRVGEDIKAVIDAFTVHGELIAWKPPRNLTDEEYKYANRRADQLWRKIERGTHWSDDAADKGLASVIASKLRADRSVAEIEALIAGREKEAVKIVDEILADPTVKVRFGMFKYRLAAA